MEDNKEWKMRKVTPEEVQAVAGGDDWPPSPPAPPAPYKKNMICPQCRVTTLFARWKPVYDPATNTWKNTTAVFMCPQCMTYYEVPDWDPNA